MDVLLLFLVLFALMSLGVSVWIAMGCAGLLIVGLAQLGDASALPSTLAQSLSGFELLAIPFFILAGDLMNRAGLTERIVRLLMYFVGGFRGGLAYASIGVNLFASGVSGSAPADASAVSSVMLPAMRKEGYRPEYAAAVNASAAIIGPIMPPSIPMIFVALVTNLSVGRLFVGGVIPALLLTVAMLGLVSWHAQRGRMPATTSVRPPRGELLRLARAAAPTMAAPLIIIGGIVLGIATITEIAMVATLYVLILGTVVYRTISIRDIMPIFRHSATFSSTIMVLFGVTGIFTFVIAIEQFGVGITDTVAETRMGPIAFILLAMVFFLVVGGPMDAIPAILIFLPILLPIATKLGVDPVHFGVIVVVNLMIGLLTPPIGALLFVLTKMSGVPLGTLTRAVLPFIAVQSAVLLVIALIPATVTWLPSLIFG